MTCQGGGGARTRARGTARPRTRPSSIRARIVSARDARARDRAAADGATTTGGGSDAADGGLSPTARSRADVYVDTDLDASARVVLRDVRDVVATLGAA
jgi:hypothetical protein